jgi:hypothetical protein
LKDLTLFEDDSKVKEEPELDDLRSGSGIGTLSIQPETMIP